MAPCAPCVLAPSGRAAGMQHSPSQQADPTMSRVGKFAWRIPHQVRLCDAAVRPGVTAILASPFTGLSDAVPVDPDTSISSLQAELCQSDPAWATNIIPVWPTLSRASLLFVPQPAHPSLVVIVVASPAWFAAYLLPQRASLSWILAYLQGSCSYPVLSLVPPAAISAADVAADRPIWRNGDVLFARPCEDHDASLIPPVLDSGPLVRHAALWTHDFIVSCPLRIVLWRPELHASRTTMPPGAYWSASQQAFRGEFETRYPGRWIPVPWALADEPHLCQRSDDPDHIHIIFERHVANTLAADCHVVPIHSTLLSFADVISVQPDLICLLGDEYGEVHSELREGDIVHQPGPEVLTVLGASGTNRPTPSGCPPACLS